MVWNRGIIFAAVGQARFLEVHHPLFCMQAFERELEKQAGEKAANFPVPQEEPQAISSF